MTLLRTTFKNWKFQLWELAKVAQEGETGKNLSFKLPNCLSQLLKERKLWTKKSGMLKPAHEVNYTC